MKATDVFEIRKFGLAYKIPRIEKKKLPCHAHVMKWNMIMFYRKENTLIVIQYEKIVYAVFCENTIST